MPDVGTCYYRPRSYGRKPIGRCDLMNLSSRNHSSVLRSTCRRISLLLLNPPSSCRGNRRYSAILPNGTMYASAAMTFLVTSLHYLHHRGSVVAVLPYGALHSQKDRSAWHYIRHHYKVSVIDTPQRGYFPHSSVSIAVVRLSPISVVPNFQPARIRSATPSFHRLSVKLTRGCQPVHRTRKRSSGPILVHSTELRDAKVYINGRRGISSQRNIVGPAVLLPRVGCITTEKIAISCTDFPIALSDCVIGISTNSLQEARMIRNRLVDSFSLVRAQYIGTGAPFITVERLTDTLSSLGIDAYGC